MRGSLSEQSPNADSSNRRGDVAQSSLGSDSDGEYVIVDETEDGGQAQRNLARPDESVGEAKGDATDGCSTMMGKKSGLTACLKQMQPRLMALHCVAHRLRLA